MNSNYLNASEKSVLNGKQNYYISSNYDEKCIRFLPKLSYTKIYDLSSSYPDHNYSELKESIKSLFGIKNISLSTGCEDLIIKICSITSNENVGVVLPTFYRITDNLKKFTSISWSEFNNANYKKLKYVFIVNPNTLNGQYISKKEILKVIKSNPKTIFIVDETSIVFLDNWKDVTLSRDSNKYNNLLVISSFSKFFGLSGNRIGFATGTLNLLNKLKLNLETFPISNLCAFIGKSIISNHRFIEFTKKRIFKNKTEISKLLAKSKKIATLPSLNNCIYCYSTDGTNIYKKLESIGVIGLDLDCQKGIDRKGLVRLTVHGSDKKHNFLITKLKQII